MSTTISRSELYAKRMYDQFVEHAETCETCKKAAPEYRTKSLCNIGMARAIEWEGAEKLVAREARRGNAPDATDEARA